MPFAKLFVTASLLASFALSASAQTRLLRFPDIHEDRIVFTHAGDLWLASSTGGAATRLTAHPGLELFGKFSPDGQSIAFTGQYGGDEQVYVIPTRGGVPTQLTFYPARGPLPPRWGFDNQVYNWTPDGAGVLFRSQRDWFSLPDSRLYIVAVDGGLPTALPMPLAGAGDLSPDGQRIAYSPLFRDFRTWKRYSGGWAQELYIFDLQRTAISQITDDPRADRDPMWIDDAIYFSSDRTGTLNIFRYDLDSGQTTQTTRYTDADVRWPSAGPNGQIVYELGGALHVLDTRTGQDRELSIFVPNDGVAKRPERIRVADNIESFGLSPAAERALFVARGDVFTVPAEHGLTRNLTHSSDAHDREAAWSPDGEQIVFISDSSGEEELWLVAQSGDGTPKQLTKGNKTRFYAPSWAPDGKRIAISDKDGEIFVVDAANGRMTSVGKDGFGTNQSYAWSPNGGHLAFSLSNPNGFTSLYIWSSADEQTRRITDETFNEHTPTWDPSGDYLFYLSTREYQPQISSFEYEWNYISNRVTGIFALALREDVENPFPPKNDEVGQAKEEGDEDKGKENGEAEEDEEPPYIEIDFENLARRVTRVPVDADNYAGIVATETHLIYTKNSAFYYGRDPAFKPILLAFSREDEKAEELAKDVDSWVVSEDGKKLLALHEKEYKLYTIGSKEEPKTVATGGLEVARIPAEEWATMFDEVWRRFRDHFYVDNMHGYDWPGLRERYRPLLEHMAHRSDLNYVIGEMIAELSVSHAYVAGGDLKLPERPSVALPGARFELGRSNRYRVAEIFEGQNEEERYRSPLTEVGVDVNVGDYVLAINGRELTADVNPYELLQAAAGQPVELRINSKPSTDGARSVLYKPIASESDLIYLKWVLANRARVREASNDRIGYLHIPDMADNGIREFIKWYYPQIRKDGLIVDVRGNGGGNVSQMLINRLDRKLLGLTYTRTWDYVGTYPNVVFTGPMVALINETSASDGDIFPWAFSKAELGPLIGKRSWGGVVGITGRGALLDGGEVYVPEFGSATADGNWAVEGYGVDPDIEVDNDPVAVIEGRDPQLERGIEEVMKRMADMPARLPERPAAPVKTQ